MLSFRSLDFRPTDAFDGLLTVEFAVEVLCEYDVLSQVFGPPFERPFEHFGLRETASLCDLSNPVGNLGGYTLRLLGNIDQSVSARPVRI